MPDAPTSPDRRAQRSRDLLLEALVALMMERGFERLTVQNLMERAGVGRATFYAHFESKDALLACSVANLRDWLEQAWKTAPAHRLGFTLPFFQHLASHRRMYQMTIVRESETTVERHIRSMLRDLVRQDLRVGRATAITDTALDLAVPFVVATLWACIVWWMESAPHLPPDEMNVRFQSLCFPGLQASLDGGSQTAVRAV